MKIHLAVLLEITPIHRNVSETRATFILAVVPSTNDVTELPTATFWIIVQIEVSSFNK